MRGPDTAPTVEVIGMGLGRARRYRAATLAIPIHIRPERTVSNHSSDAAKRFIERWARRQGYVCGTPQIERRDWWKRQPVTTEAKDRRDVLLVTCPMIVNPGIAVSREVIDRKREVLVPTE